MSAEAWEGMQRHGHDIAERLNSLAHDLNCLLLGHVQSIEDFNHNGRLPTLSWPPWSNGSAGARVHFAKRRVVSPAKPDDGASVAFFEIGKRLTDAGAGFGARLGDIARSAFQYLPHRREEESSHNGCLSATLAGETINGRFEVLSSSGTEPKVQHLDDDHDDDDGGPKRRNRGRFDATSEQHAFDFQSNLPESFRVPQGSITVSTSYDSRMQKFESSVLARGDLWRAEVSHGGLSRNSSSPLFMLQLGPILFVRDTTLLLPVHLSKRHLLWYGFDRKNGLHSLCPAVWSKHRRWLCMSMICLNPLSCSFMDVQFPNGQLTYVSGEGLTGSAIVPAFGGFMQAQGHYPGETSLGFSYKTRWGTQLMPVVQWPDRSFSVGLEQPLSYRRSGAMVRPTINLSVAPTIGGHNAGWRAEVNHAVTEKLSLACGYACTSNPSAFASMSVGRAKGPGTSGLDFRVERPLDSMGRLSFSIKLNSSIEF